MRTDKQVFRIFEAVPEWIFELTQLDSPGPSELRSFSLKELERHADGLLVPRDPSQPLTIIEFQFQSDETIYTRTVREMVAAQELHAMRAVEGLVVFAYNALDPQTQPWTRIVRSFSFDRLLSALEGRQPEHPLVAVFKPMVVEDEAVLADSAIEYYRTIKQSRLDEKVKEALLEVFVSWLEQRFREMSKQEIEAMLIGELPDLEETRSGKDMIAIGEARGKVEGIKEGKMEGIKEGKKEGRKEGMIKSIVVFLEAKHGKLSKELQKAISALSSAQANKLLAHLPQCRTLADVRAWLDENG